MGPFIPLSHTSVMLWVAIRAHLQRTQEGMHLLETTLVEVIGSLEYSSWCFSC